MRRSLQLLTAPSLLLLALACGGGGGGGDVQTPDFTMGVAPTTLSVPTGQNGTVTVNLTRTGGHASAVTFSLASPPAGISGSGSASGGSSSAVFTVSVTTGTAAGTYPLTVQGTDGTLTRSTSLSLQVTPVANATWRFNSAVSWFAFQDGTGAWTPVTGSAGTYSFTFNQPTGAVAYVLDGGSSTSQVVVTYGSLAELASRDFRTTQGDNLTVSGTYAGLGATESADFNLGFQGYAYASGATATSGTWGIDYMDRGLQDLLAVAFRSDNTPRRMVIHRALNVQSAGSLGTPGAVDFAAEGSDLTAQTLTITGTGPAAGELLRAWQSFETDQGSAPLMSRYLTGTLQTPIYAVPNALRAAADRDAFAVQIGPDDGTGYIDVKNFRTVWLFGQTPGDVSVAAPAALTAPTATVAATAPYVLVRTQWAFDTVFNQVLLGTFTQGTRIWAVEVLPGHGASVDLTLPNFSGLAGWSNTWGFSTGSAVTAAYQANGQDWTTWPPAAGSRSTQAAKSQTLNP